MNRCYEYPFDRIENLDSEYLIATYLVYGLELKDALSKISNFAIGQTIGTWVKLPGITDYMVQNYQARVIGFYEIPGADEVLFILKVAFPMVNFSSSFALMLTALVGNDVSTALRTKLIDIELTSNSTKIFKGPNKPIRKLRRITNTYNRPLILNMIKPCTGFSPKEGAKLFYDVALGGVDLIKDDELLGSPSYNKVCDRIIEYNKAANSAFEITGKKTVYIPNITDKPSKMIENAKAAIDAGAKACMINFVFAGLDTLSEICDRFSNELFIMAHYAGVGVMNWEKGGISNQVYLATLPRLAGADAVMTMFPKETDASALLDFYKTIQAQKLNMAGIDPIITAVGGGITPIDLERIYKNLGNDIIIGVGGAIQGHPNGSTAGAKATMTALNAAVTGLSLNEAAKSCENLKVAIKTWKGDNN